MATCASSAVALAGVAGRTEERKMEGTSAENPPDIQDALDKSSAGPVTAGKSGEEP